MNRTELAAALAAVEVASNIYSLDGNWTALANDGYLMVETGGSWAVQYFERGTTKELARFDSESAACEYLYARLTEPTTLRQLAGRWKPTLPR